MIRDAELDRALSRNARLLRFKQEVLNRLLTLDAPNLSDAIGVAEFFERLNPRLASQLADCLAIVDWLVARDARTNHPEVHGVIWQKVDLVIMEVALG